jgi:endogenous inhibitor of DNA gyrase (YacG/DUF329 family)
LCRYSVSFSTVPAYLFRVKRKCPTCGRQLADADEVRGFRPFCSERCRAADLGKWLDGGYRIESPISEEDLDQGLPTDGNPERTQ